MSVETAITKVCSRCKKSFSATTEFFYENRSRKDRLHCYCKQCSSEVFKIWRTQWVANGKPKGRRPLSATKICPQCKREFPRTKEFFYRYPSGRFHGWCRSCLLGDAKKRRQKSKLENPDSVRLK